MGHSIGQVSDGIRSEETFVADVAHLVVLLLRASGSPENENGFCFFLKIIKLAQNDTNFIQLKEK